MIVTVRGTLPASVEAVWELLTDWERQAEWMADADRVTVVSEHREGLGARVAVKTRLFGIPMFTETLEVSRWDPPSALDVTHSGPVRGAGRWRLTRRGQGTDFLWVEDIRLAIPGAGELAARLYAPVMRRLMGRAVTRLAGLF